MLKSFALAAPLIVGSGCATVAEILFQAEPDRRVIVGIDGVIETILMPAQRTESQVIIEMRDDQFFWSSRGGLELDYRPSGVFDVFVARSGAGYIKIERGEPALFLEHVHVHLGTVTYFGPASVYHVEILE